MYHYVTDKEFLKRSYSKSADLVNQLTQELRREGIETKMSLVGSGKRGLVTQNGKGPIDYDFNLWILGNAQNMREQKLKETIMAAFDYVLEKNRMRECYCKDSKSVISTPKMKLNGGNQTGFSIDLCIVKEDCYGDWYRLIHEKTGFVQQDRWFWNMGPNKNSIYEKEYFIKEHHLKELKRTYLEKKNMYLKRNDNTHPSFVCYLEALNEVYYKYSNNQYFNGMIPVASQRTRINNVKVMNSCFGAERNWFKSF